MSRCIYTHHIQPLCLYLRVYASMYLCTYPRYNSASPRASARVRPSKVGGSDPGLHLDADQPGGADEHVCAIYMYKYIYIYMYIYIYICARHELRGLRDPPITPVPAALMVYPVAIRGSRFPADSVLNFDPLRSLGLTPSKPWGGLVGWEFEPKSEAGIRRHL